MATIITKNSSTASSVPAAGSLQQGELAVNVTDKKLYTKDSTAAVVKLVGSLGNQEANAVAITGGTINGTAIGGTSPSTGAFTTVSASGGFTGNLTGNASTVTNGVYTTGSYADPAWITSLAGSKITGNISGNAANVTGTVAIANGGTGLTALGTGVQTALGQTVTGSGGIVLANSPSLTTPNLGTPSAVTLTNATGLPVATGISGLGTNVATALGVSVGSAGSFVVNGGALGTPSSGTVTNLTGTASININGTVGATTPNTGSFTTLTTSSTVTINAGTANGVAYLNGSKVLTTGSALTFDGSKLLVGSNTAGYGTLNVARDTTSPYASLTVTDEANANNTVGVYLRQAGSGPAGFSTAGAPLAFYLGGPGTSEAMRLTSTGLGIGTSSPIAKIDLGTGTGQKLSLFTNGNVRYGLGIEANEWRAYATAGAVLTFGHMSGSDGVTFTERLRLDSAGNAGLGVTPSAWGGGIKAIDLGAGSAVLNPNSTAQTWFLTNAYHNAGFKYKNTGDLATWYQQSAGTHAWYTAPSGTAGNTISFTQALTLNTNGALVLQGGNTSASGVGITFPATQSASSNANTLDDYEEGDWTPVLGGSSESGQTYSRQAGKYTKVGRLVTCTFDVVLTNRGTLAGDARIKGLPFTVGNDNGFRAAFSCAEFFQLNGSYIQVSGIAIETTTQVYIRVSTGASASSGIPNAVDFLSNSTQIIGTITYMV